MVLRAFVDSEIKAMSIQRIVEALKNYAPNEVQFVPREEADIIVHTVVGVQNFGKVAIPDMIAADTAAGKAYAIIQCCVASTERPSAAFWAPIWAGAKCVWSYLDLLAFVNGARTVDGECSHAAHDLWVTSANDTVPSPLSCQRHPQVRHTHTPSPTIEACRWSTALPGFPLYYAPLGVDDQVFNFNAARGVRDITMLTTGYVAESEGIREVSEAVRRVNGWHLHVGPDLKFGAHVTSISGISDARLASLYGRAKFVAGLRRCEGFELPAAEGLLCGARPILFDTLHYKQWFSKWGVFVPEDDPDSVATAIEKVFRQNLPQVTQRTAIEAGELFDWTALVGGFWGKCLASMGGAQ